MNAARSHGIVGERVQLRALVQADLDLLRSFVNDPEVMRFSNIFRPISDDQEERWYQQVSQTRNNVYFGIIDRRPQQGGQLIGTCSLVGIDWISRVAELRIRIGDRNVWGQGLGTEASQLLIRYGFMDLNLARIWLRVFASNQRAIHMYEKLGFQTEGRLRKAIFIKGSAEDVILMGLLRGEWSQITASELGDGQS